MQQNNNHSNVRTTLQLGITVAPSKEVIDSEPCEYLSDTENGTPKPSISEEQFACTRARILDSIDVAVKNLRQFPQDSERDFVIDGFLKKKKMLTEAMTLVEALRWGSPDRVYTFGKRAKRNPKVLPLALQMLQSTDLRIS